MLGGALSDLLQNGPRALAFEDLERLAIVAFAWKPPIEIAQVRDVLIVDEHCVREKARALVLGEPCPQRLYLNECSIIVGKGSVATVQVRLCGSGHAQRTPQAFGSEKLAI
jgi:hypothetical protein